MVVYLPIAICRDLIYNLLDRKWIKEIYSSNNLSNSLVDFPLRVNETDDDQEVALKSYLMTDMSLSETEAGQPLLFKNQEDELNIHEETCELSLLEVIKCSLCLAPIWFITEVLFRQSLCYILILYTFLPNSTNNSKHHC